MDISNLVAAFAAVAALGLSLFTLRRQNLLEQNAYVILRLDLEPHGPDRLIAHTALENRSPAVKRIDSVLLLVSPVQENPVDAFNALMADSREKAEDLRDLGALAAPKVLEDGTRFLFPLSYYTVENSEVADEVLTYDVILDLENLTSGGDYSVRLILYGPDRLHRIVQRAFSR